MLHYLYCILLGYFVGTFNPSYLLAQHRGVDIREQGSGNAGASNALILFGKLRGVICALLDIGKTVLVIRLTARLFPTLTYSYAVTAVSCILGHIFPFYLKFRGGKGLACLGGAILAYDWRVFLIMLAAELVIALLTNYICFVPITASVVFPLLYGHLEQNLIGTLILCAATAVILYKHHENILRIKEGKEMRLSYLWDREGEPARLRENYSDEDPRA